MAGLLYVDGHGRDAREHIAPGDATRAELCSEASYTCLHGG